MDWDARAAQRRLQRAINVTGLALERLGKRSIETLRSFARHPTLMVAIVTGLLFALARYPTEIFYSEVGLRPEDVGLNSVQVLLQGSAVLLALSLLLGLAVVVFFFLGFWIASYVWASGTGHPARVLKTLVRLSVVPALVMTVGFSLWLLIQVAESQSDAVHDGRGISPGLYPWRAEPVRVTWTGPARHPLPSCDRLFYLGEANDRVALYDATRNTTYRIVAEDLELEFPLNCPSGSPERDSNS